MGERTRGGHRPPGDRKGACTMLYLTGDGLTIIILESANLDEIRKGRPAKTPDGKVLIAWRGSEMLPRSAQDDSGNGGGTDMSLDRQFFSGCFTSSVRAAYLHHLFRSQFGRVDPARPAPADSCGSGRSYCRCAFPTKDAPGLRMPGCRHQGSCAGLADRPEWDHESESRQRGEFASVFGQAPENQ